MTDRVLDGPRLAEFARRAAEEFAEIKSMRMGGLDS